MQATIDDVATMLNMQHIDLELLQANKRFEALPQRKAILEARAKRTSILQKKEQLEKLHAESMKKFTRISDEDASLAEKQQRVQGEIDASHGDYRSVEARTKELNGFAKRRNVLEADLTKLGDELAKIEGVQKQVAQMLETLDAQEAQSITSFQRQGGQLKEDIARLEGQRAPLAASLSAELLAAYDSAAQHGGVAIGRLTENGCGVCRHTIDGGRMIDIKAQAPLATCPNCKRLLVVE